MIGPVFLGKQQPSILWQKRMVEEGSSGLGGQNAGR